MAVAIGEALDELRCATGLGPATAAGIAASGSSSVPVDQRDAATA
jgi:hypothetical protein